MDFFFFKFIFNINPNLCALQRLNATNGSAIFIIGDEKRKIIVYYRCTIIRTLEVP